MQAGSKRRRTQKQIAEDKEEELRKEQDVAAQLAELAALRERMSGLEQEISNGKAASNLLNQMIEAGHVVQDSQDSVIVNAANGQQRFAANAGAQN